MANYIDERVSTGSGAILGTREARELEPESLYERTAARLAAAGDDAADLARGLALDCLLHVHTAIGMTPGGPVFAESVRAFEERAARLARLCLRCCREAARLCDLAEVVGAEAWVPLETCARCVDRPAETPDRLCLRCAVRVTTGGR